MDLSIKELMTEGVISACATTPLLELVQSMRDRRLSCLVVTEKGIPVGIVTERDVVHILAQSIEDRDYTQGLCAGDVMSAPPITIQENATLFEALVIARSRNIRHLPVVSTGGDFVGMITQSNLVEAHFALIERQTEALEKNVLQRTAELAEANERLQALSLTDSLLGIGNRRAMEVDLDHTLSGSVRYQHPCCLALLDVDYFKRYNDHYGHQAGDVALQQVATHVQSRIRGSDRLYRYGGEELLLLMPETELVNGTLVVNRLVSSLAESAIPHEQSPLKVLTVSAGVAGIGAPAKPPVTAAGVIEEADRHLYTAKHNGRNCACAA